MTVLSIDIGTTRTKAALFTDGLKRLALESAPTAGFLPDGRVDAAAAVGGAVRLAAAVVSSARRSASGAAGAGSPAAREIAAVAVSSFLCHVPCTEDGLPVAPGLPWGWNRAACEADELSRTIGAAAGRPVAAELLAPRLLWSLRHDPGLLAGAPLILGLKDCLVARLCGEAGTDTSHRDYSLLADRFGRPIEPVARALREAGLHADPLPAVRSPHALAGRLTAAAAAELGLQAGTPVAAGSTDGTAAMYGAGVLADGVIAGVFGTTDVFMRAVSDPPPFEVPRWASINAAAVEGTALVGGSTGASGPALAWWRARLGSEADGWAEVAAGADGLTALPGFDGERAPFIAPRAGGGFVGLRSSHTGAHLVRALLEAQCFRVRMLVAPLVNGECRLVFGGGNTGGALDALRADVLPLPLARRSEPELSLCGAAMFALALYEDEAMRAAADARLRELGRAAAADSEPVSPPAGDRYDRLFETWSRTITSLLPLSEAP